jgi:hypothetical protein
MLLLLIFDMNMQKTTLDAQKEMSKKKNLQNVNHKIIQVVANLLLKQLLMSLNHQPSIKDSICVALIYFHNFLPKLLLNYEMCKFRFFFFQKSSFCHSLFELAFVYFVKFVRLVLLKHLQLYAK